MSSARLPRGIWALGFVSLLMDTSSELIHSLLPVFMVSALGASMTLVGVVEGVAEATASVTRVVSGAVSDRFRRRKLPAVVGYGLAALSKPLFPLASTIGWVFTGRFLDRVGKGIRGAPRDALVAELAPEDRRGAAFGLRQALDSVGAFLGPLAAIALMAWLADDLRVVLWIAVIPAVLAVAVLVVAVHEPDRAGKQDSAARRVVWSAVRSLPAAYWGVTAVGFVFGLARFSEAFLVLRAQDGGLSMGMVPIVVVVMNVAYAASAYPAGRAADRVRSHALLLAGMAALVAADLVLASSGATTVVLTGSALWGLHLGLTQGLFAKLVADSAPSAVRATGFGLFHLANGIAVLAASLIGGWLWDLAGPRSTFLAGATFAALAASAFTIVRYRRGP